MSQLVVECDSEGDRGWVPRRFGRLGNLREVVRVTDRWSGGDHEYFRVATADGSTYILRRDLARPGWRIHYFLHSERVGGA